MHDHDRPEPRADSLDLNAIQCDVKISRPFPGTEVETLVSDIPHGFVELEATFTLEVVDFEEDTVEDQVIASASAYAIRIDVDWNRDRLYARILDSLDSVGGEAFHIAEVVCGAGDILSDLDRPYDGGLELTTQLVFVDDVFVEEPYRRQGLGSQLLGALIDAADGTGNQSLVMLRAWSTHWPDVSELDARRLQKNLELPLANIGFGHYMEGVYWRHTALALPSEIAPQRS
ncbi:GNAT family N-acetyltransferase [Microbacterium sp. SL62]|uniref:GNAT family N-acetyltransferase n=1 Tax=Microbacterium sp. SL62 TaxID=2995139 RepID=UPI0022769787|nr:GNAT family N-acetyltransferase [Microbacterium sp. SL62]MCY1718579.1 GNAT family N-acetyltransferase [Microbacterium sp. SL62]